MTKKNPDLMNGRKDPKEANIRPAGMYLEGSATPAGMFSVDAHENLIRSKGFKAYHYRHALNPNRTTPEAGVDLTSDTVNGFRFYDRKEFYVVPQNMKWEDIYMVHGVHGQHVMVVNHTGRYTDTNERVFLRPGDLVTFEDPDMTTVMVEELFEADKSGVNILRFPVFSVDYMADANTRYEEEVDFSVQDGSIVWNNVPTGSTSKVMSCVYWTKPVFVVKDIPRVFRTVWANEYGSASKQGNATYVPGSAILSMAWLQNGLSINKDNWKLITGVY